LGCTTNRRGTDRSSQTWDDGLCAPCKDFSKDKGARECSRVPRGTREYSWDYGLCAPYVLRDENPRSAASVGYSGVLWRPFGVLMSTLESF
jgi:hypothetical protein